MNSLTDSPAWQSLRRHAAQFQQPDFRLDSLFAQAGDRFDRFSVEADGLLLDYSKNYLDEDTLSLLLELARERDLAGAISAMFAGEKINNTEHRPALHVALREPVAECRYPEVAETLARMERFVAAVHDGEWLGHNGERITDVVNIGIGGSDLGPAMVVDALADFAHPGLRVHFVSNVDPSHLDTTLRALEPQTTLFIVASKSFTTLETRQNAEAARRWLLAAAGDESAVARHFVASTSNLEAATDFGIDGNNLFPLWDWVGGRYSLWSAIGLPIALAVGMDHFRELLRGARHMDTHFRSAEPGQNLPVILGLLTVWYTGLFAAHSTAVVPYSQRLGQMPAFLQQLYMESLGKRVQRDGSPVHTPTGEVLWGTAGTNGQHSYFQLLHQGTAFIPVDFIACARPGPDADVDAHRHLLANCLSQSLALMQGAEDDNPHKQVPGNKPSNTLLLERLDPFHLGSLIALYEHKVYVQSVIWNINAFDQWGVELGKKLSRTLYTSLGDSRAAAELDASSAGLIARIDAWKEI